MYFRVRDHLRNSCSNDGSIPRLDILYVEWLIISSLLALFCYTNTLVSSSCSGKWILIKVFAYERPANSCLHPSELNAAETEINARPTSETIFCLNTSQQSTTQAWWYEWKRFFVRPKWNFHSMYWELLSTVEQRIPNNTRYQKPLIFGA